MIRRSFLAAVTLAALGSGAQASPLSDPYTSFWTLGDSLTDNGNLFAVVPSAIPSPPYFEGRVSSGPTYAEYLAADFSADGKPTDNLAFAGARAVADADGIPDLLAQVFAPVGTYADGEGGLVTRIAQFGARPLVSVFIGANDILGAFASGGNPIAAAGDAATTVLSAIGGIAALGVQDFLVFGMPDFARIPRLNTEPAPVQLLATTAAQTFDATIAAGIGALPSGITVTQIDVSAALWDLLDNPGAAGLTNTTDACLSFGIDADGNRTITGICADPETYAYFDDIHPSGTVHAALAQTVRGALVTPVPLPAAGWALLAGLGGLAAVARRRAGR